MREEGLMRIHLARGFQSLRGDQGWLRRKGQKGCSLTGRGKEAPMSCPDGEALKVSLAEPICGQLFSLRRPITGVTWSPEVMFCVEEYSTAPSHEACGAREVFLLLLSRSRNFTRDKKGGRVIWTL